MGWASHEVVVSEWGEELLGCERSVNPMAGSSLAPRRLPWVDEVASPPAAVGGEEEDEEQDKEEDEDVEDGNNEDDDWQDVSHEEDGQ